MTIKAPSTEEEIEGCQRAMTALAKAITLHHELKREGIIELSEEIDKRFIEAFGEFQNELKKLTHPI